MSDAPRLASESIAGQRPYQEDSVLVTSLSDGRVLVAVADGMGGHAAGEVASALALETLVSALEEGQGIDKAVALANRKVHEKADEPGKHGMGTTLVAALVEDGEYMIANVGDSRGYLLTADGIRQVTEDHSFVAEAMKRGQSQAEAMATPWKDALTRSIGTEPQVEVDVFGPFPVQEDTALLLCSDGLYKTLSDEDLQDIFRRSSTPEAAAQVLVSTALERGSDDNISVAIAEYGEIPRDETAAPAPGTDSQSTLVMSFSPEEGAADPGPVTTTDEDAAGDEELVGESSGSLDDAIPTSVVTDPGLASSGGIPKGALIAAAVVAAVVLVALLLL